MIEYIKSIIMGIFQGLTEFLPVSSSGHLAVLQNEKLFGKVMESSTTFTLLLHVGTLAAVLLVYYKDVWDLIKSFFSIIGKIFTGKFKFKTLNQGEKFFCLLFVALIPLVLGVFLEKPVEFLSNYIYVVGIFWIICATVFMISESKWVQNKIKARKFDDIKPKHALGVGLFQLFAILPGISRSGSTIIGGVLHGFKREFAVKFSFILSIPAILGATVFDLIDLVSSGDTAGLDTNIGPIIAGVTASFIAGLAAIKMLQYITNKHNFKIFAYYMYIIGVLAIGYDVVTNFVL